MKRRNGEFCGKYRRPLKKSKLIGEGFYGSTLLYFKFLMVWSLVLLADFILEFRFEYLWPFWLLLRSVYDSVKYQGLAFSVFFVFIALTSDMICFLFIPVHWLFFAASTYVWVQYVWHTEKGICLSTISLWLLFVYIEASIRLKELKSLPFHLDLCRPFAAHCIGYFVVTLGFGFKSYVSYKMRLRKQKEVSKENEFFIELLQQSLPQESCSISSSSAGDNKIISNGIGHHPSSNHQISLNKKSLNSSEKSSILNQSSHFSKLKYEYDHKKLNSNGIDKHELQYMEHQIMKRISAVNDFEDDCNHKNSFKNLSASISNKPTSHSSNHVASNCLINANSISSSVSTNSTNKKTKNILANNLNSQKDEHALRLEADMKKLKADLQASRQCESELKGQINLLLSGERNLKAEVLQSQQDNENLQTKLHNLVTARQQDKQTIAQLEKKLNEEKKSRINIETQLATERKAKKAEEAVVMATAVRSECSDSCKNKKRELENDIKQMKRELKIKEDQLRQIDIEAQSLRQYKDSHGDTEILMSALSAMQEKNAHLEKNLSAETRLKLDLFSALGDTKRQLGINQALLIKKDKEIDELKSKIAEMMAVMPETSSFTGLDNSLVSSMLYNSKYISDQAGSNESAISKSTLDPNASVYSPKASDVWKKVKKTT